MKKQKSGREIRVGVVGYGGAFNMGKCHFDEMIKAGMVPAAVCDPDAARRKVAEQDYPGIKTFADLGELLRKSDVQLLTLITPHNLHARQALQCLKAGRSVVCEKPMAITTDECDAMLKAAKAKGLVLSTYHNRHWDGHILTAKKKIIDEKAIGNVHRIELHMGGYGQPGDWWRSSKTISGGILYDWGVHLLEYALQMLPGAKLKEVAGYARNGFWAPKTKWKKDTNEDEGQLTARFDTGAWISLNVSQIDSFPKQEDRGIMEVTGDLGTYVMDFSNYRLIRHRKGVKTVETGPNAQGESWKFYQNIADHLNKGAKLVITPEWSRRPIHILDLGCRSAKQGKALPARHS